MTTTIDLHPMVGEPAPHTRVRRAVDGTEFRLCQMWDECPAVLVFLRYLGCPFCREHAAKIHDDLDHFRGHGVRIAFITTGKQDDMRSFCEVRDLSDSVECLSDTDGTSYRAFGLARGGVAEMFAPAVIARGLQAALHGHFLGMPKGDPFQLPGVFIVDRDGIIRYAHRNKTASDNPPNSDLLRVLESLA